MQSSEKQVDRRTSLKLVAPAKVNLFLQVVGKRQDGYHELASLFQAVDLCDTVLLSVDESDRLICRHPDIPADNSNLALQAVQLFRRRTGLNFGARVVLEKKIPVAAGLGGGSSNAASVLWGLNQLLGRPASLEQLAFWGSELGSDVPFFLSTGTAYCTGRGEKVRSLPPLSPCNLWIVKPQEGLSTPDVYRTAVWSSAHRHDPEQILSGFLAGRPTCFNDLEAAAFALLPSLGVLKKTLIEAGFNTVMMSGSGTAFFCIGDAVPPKLEGALLAKVSFINRSPDGWYTETY